MSSSCKHEKSTCAERKFLLPLSYIAVYIALGLQGRGPDFILDVLSPPHSPFWRGELLALDTTRRAILTLLSRWKLGECHKDEY